MSASLSLVTSQLFVALKTFFNFSEPQVFHLSNGAAMTCKEAVNLKGDL